MAAPRSRRCSLSLLTLFSISLILISVSLFVSTKPTHKPLIDYRNQFSVSISFPPSTSPLGQNNTTNTTLAPVSSPSPLPLLRESNTTNTTLASISPSSSFSDQQNQNKNPSPTSKRVVIRVCTYSFFVFFYSHIQTSLLNMIKTFLFLIFTLFVILKTILVWL